MWSYTLTSPHIIAQDQLYSFYMDLTLWEISVKLLSYALVHNF